MLNKSIIIILISFLYSCSYKKILNKEKFNLYKNTKLQSNNFFLFDSKKRDLYYIQYYSDEQITYRVKGKLVKYSKNKFITNNESIESTLVDSTLNIIPLKKEIKDMVKTKLINDTLFFSDDFKSFKYNKYEFRKNLK